MRNKLLLSLLLAPAIVITAAAQETTGGVQGIVKDPQGAVVAGATIVVTSPALIGKKTVTTDSGGRYHIEQLPPGDYTITATGPGFGTETQQGLHLKTGALPNVNFDLKIGQTEQTVEVSAQAQEVDVTSSKVSANVTEDILTGIPKGRSFQTVIPFAPGARQEPLQGASNARNNGFQIDGATDSENVYLQDGVNITNIQNGGIGKNFQRDFIQEVQIKSSSFEAEFGGALGGVINAVPKHGSNNWHGEIKGYWQSSALNASDPCASGFTANNFFNTINVATPTTNCGQRIDPSLSPLNTTTRLDGTPQYYIPKKDNRHILEPG
ncbi:MAG TPA: TonB-dependent receptor, partial [Terriglobales bacterium]